MTLKDLLSERAGGKCELCASGDNLLAYDVQPNAGESLESSALVCEQCIGRMGDKASLDPKQWYGLSESMWSEHAPVKVLVYRVLKSMGDNPWALDLLGQLYLDDETQKWADAGLVDEESGDAPVRDSNGTVLQEGDTVTLIKDLDVKGANFTAKRGTTVKGINLTDDPKYVEGRVNGIRIVLVAAYLKKA